MTNKGGTERKKGRGRGKKKWEIARGEGGVLAL